MYHHSESPEVIHAKLAEWERTVTAHRAQAEAERLPTGDEDRPTPPAARSLSALLHPVSE